MRIALALLLALGACTHRASIPPPAVPLVATPADAVPGPPAALAAPDVPRLDFERRILPNGFGLVMAAGAPNGIVSVVYVNRAAERWDTRAHEIVTRLFAATVLRATRGESPDAPDAIDDLLDVEGFSPEVDLGADGLFVHDRVLATELPRYLALLDRALRTPVFRPADLNLVLGSHIEQLEAHRLSPDGLIAERLPSMLYAGSDPRSAPFTEHIEVLRRLDVAALSARHTEVMDPLRSSLVIVGDLDPDAVHALVSSRFAAWAPNDSPPRTAPAVVRTDEAPRGLAVVQPLVRSYVKLLERAPALGDPDHAAFLVLEQLLGGMFGARLNLELRERRGISYGFHAAYRANGGAGELEMVTAVDTRHTRLAVESMIGELRRVRGEGAETIAPAELELARTRAREGLLGELDTSEGLALHAARRIAIGQDPTALIDDVERVDALTREEIEAAARRWIRPMRAPMVVVGAGGVLDDVRRAGVGAFEVIRAPERRRR